tara:strand:- start:820 stop:1779 length:960 start_codon:yes stop_codon:yes gene_type:complete
MLSEFILLEYFTAQSTINFKEKKSIFKEAIKLSNELALNFSRNSNIKKIHIIRNKSLKTINNKKILTHSVCEKNKLEKILEEFKNKTKLLLISPETEFKSLNLYKKLNEKFILLNSSFKEIKVFSSKFKTYEALKKNKINAIKIEKELKENIQYVSKPEFGTGSTDIVIFYKNKKNKNQKKNVIQKYYKGKKGSFAMLCYNKSFEILCCNEQLLKFKNNRIYQVGLIMGGLEPYRHEISELGKKISNYFPNLFGYIGVDIIKVRNKWKVIEINPRFTSSYVGLEQSYGKTVINKINKFYISKKLNEKKIKLKKKVEIYF